jgi:transposase
MPQINNIVNIPGVVVKKSQGINPIKLYAEYKGDILCPHCNSTKLRHKKTFTRQLRHESIGKRITILFLKSRQYLCKDCHRYFNLEIPGIMKWKRATEAFRKEVFEKHVNGISQVDMARMLRIGSATVERWTHDLIKRKNQEYLSYECSEYIGIDEHSFSKKMGFATTLCDLTNHRILDVFPGRSVQALDRYFKKLKGKERVKMICIDLSETYRAVAKKHFPNARIVTDRFHVIRLINQAFLKTWHTFDPDAKHSKGLLSLMRRHQWNMRPDQESNLFHYMDHHPGLKPIYQFKQNLVKLLLIKHQTRQQCKRLVPKLLHFIQQLKQSHFEQLVRLANTLEKWAQELVCMWRFTKNNGITEGFHRKMKLIQRRAYGFKNFENYRLRVRFLCS